MSESDYDIKIKLATSYDGAGEQAAAEGLQEVRRAAAEAAAEATQEVGRQVAEELEKLAEATKAHEQKAAAQERAAEKAAAAQRRAKVATEEASAAEDKLKRQMELASKSRNELIRELERLAAARKAAAAAGNTAEFERLTAQSAETREAFEKLNQGLELTNIQFMQQAQMGMQVGQTLAGIGAAAAQGGGNVAGLAAQFLSLGAAIKAGLGPFGWAMAILQGLQMAWDYFTQKQERAVAAMKEAREAQEQLNKTLLEAAQTTRAAVLEVQRDTTEQEVADIERARAARLRALDEVQQRERQFAAARLERLRTETQAQLAALETRRSAELITQEAAAAESERLQRELREAEEAEAAADDARQRKRLALERETNAAVAAARQEMLDKMRADMGNLLTHEWNDFDKVKYEELTSKVAQLKGIISAEQAVLEAVNKQMEAEKAGADNADVLADLRRRREQAQTEIAEAQAGIARADEEAEFIFRGMLDDVRKLAKARNLTGMAALELALQTQEAYAAETKKAEDAAAAVEAGKRAEAELSRTADLRKQQNEALEAGLEVEKQAVTEAAAALQKKKEEEESTQRKKKAEAERTAQLAELWADVQRKSLPEQQQWLEQTVNSLAAGSEAAKQWARQLEAVKLRQVQEELNGLATVYKVTGSYAQKDTRTQEEIYAADRAALEARRTALEQLRQQPGLDAATQKNINDKLAETRSQLAGLESAMAASAREAQQMLAGLRPLGQQAKQSNWSHALKRSEQAFLNMAKLAERQAAKGDTAGMERSIAAMKRYAAQQERLTGHTGRAVKHAHDVEKNLRLAAGATEQEASEVTRSARAGRQDERTRRRRERAEQRAAAAQEREARELEKAAREAKSDTKKARPRQQAREIAELTQELEAANRSLEEQKKAVLRLNETIGKLSAVAEESARVGQECASAALAAAQAATSSLAGLKRELEAVKRAIEKMRKE